MRTVWSRDRADSQSSFQRVVRKWKAFGFSFTPKREYRLPVVLHIDNGPALRLSYVERLVEFTDGGVAVVCPFPFSVGVVHNEGEADAASSLCPFELTDKR